MKQKMGLRSAWLYLAKKWDKPTRYEGCGVYFGRFYGVFISGEEDAGLCTSIASLLDEEMIDGDTGDAMKKAINAPTGEFLWSHDRKGAKQRAAFCRKQAAKCKPKAKKKARPKCP